MAQGRKKERHPEERKNSSLQIRLQVGRLEVPFGEPENRESAHPEDDRFRYEAYCEKDAVARFGTERARGLSRLAYSGHFEPCDPTRTSRLACRAWNPPPD